MTGHLGDKSFQAIACTGSLLLTTEIYCFILCNTNSRCTVQTCQNLANKWKKSDFQKSVKYQNSQSQGPNMVKQTWYTERHIACRKSIFNSSRNKICEICEKPHWRLQASDIAPRLAWKRTWSRVDRDCVGCYAPAGRPASHWRCTASQWRDDSEWLPASLSSATHAAPAEHSSAESGIHRSVPPSPATIPAVNNDYYYYRYYYSHFYYYDYNYY